jgi:23S rRNA (pseudouridine1915-N3)-methyltransferase
VKSSGGGDENTLYKKLEQDFEMKIKRYTKFEMIATPQNPKNEKTIEEQKESEGERVMKKIDPRDYVVLMCERGKSFTSEKFASDVLAKSGDLGHGRLVFVIGGPFGHGKEVERRADVSLRLSEMVMNHRVARMVLLEQIYRAWTIVRGEPYHH